MKVSQMSEPISSGLGLVAGVKAAPAAASVCGVLGIYAGLCAVIPLIFGPNITLIELVAGFFGTVAFYIRSYKADVHASGPMSTLISACINLFATLWILQAVYSGLTANTDYVLHQSMVSGLAFTFAFVLQNGLARVLAYIESIKLPWSKEA
jgi:hypothetical protein